MKKKNSFFILLACLFALSACENEVDLTAEYVDTTVIYGLLDVNEDTQFVKVNRAFLEENTNALQLAQDPDQLFYSDITVRLVDLSNNQADTLNTVQKPKEEGIFTTEKNIVYFTTNPIFAGRGYRLEVVKSDGQITSGRTIALDTVQIQNPNLNPASINKSVSLTRNNGQTIKPDAKLTFRHSERIAEFKVDLIFFYTEVFPNGAEEVKYVRVPISTVVNRDLREEEVTVEFNADKFYQAIANSIDPNNQNPKEIDGNSNLIFDIYAADVDFDFYREINGPLDGIAQVRPEYTNIENGIGLFASRSHVFAYSNLRDESRERIRTIDPRTSNLNFVPKN
ncbi:MAG: hypothetical protein RIC95_11790 [Vicingaceae bacterium]